MSIRDLLQWQWSGYAKYHTSRVNLLIHIIAVPLFLVGNVGLVVTLLRRSWFLAAACLVATVVSLAMQGRGHRTEGVPPERFTGAGNAVARILLEQWITFPRYVASGGWLRALRNAARGQL